ncbi:MAG: dihydrodipicolinate synthase family protein [Thermoflexales bacterium]|nr:dihydrodipicolinate synthase family protein [Thermoflexales bacterium]
MQQRYPRSILVSCEVPWDAREELIDGVFRQIVRRTLAQGFNDLYIFGTAGEGYAVDTRRFAQVTRVFHEETRGASARPMVGVIGLSTANLVERLQMAWEIGFRVFQISLPSWGPLREPEILTFFRDVCGSFPEARFLHYNLPRAKRLLTGREYRKVADACPNLVATKNTGGGAARAADLMTHASDLQHFFSEDNYPHGCQYGPCSLLSSTGFLFPAKARAIFEAGVAGDLDALYRLQHDFHIMHSDVFARFVAQERIDGAYDKMIKRAALPEMPLRLLSPYQCFSEDEFADFLRVIDEKYGEWRA